MKKVKIPSNRHPLWEAVINGVTYSYPAGATVEVPDYVADIIEELESLAPDAPEPVYHVDPFGETTGYGDTLTWDGNTDGIPNLDGVLYKVSDATPSMADFANGAMLTGSDGQSYDVPTEAIAGDSVIVEFGSVAVIYSEDLGVPPGTYFLCADGVYITSLTIPGYNGFMGTTIKPLDAKYLPKALQFGEVMSNGDTFKWNPETDYANVTVEVPVSDTYSLCKVSDITPAEGDLANGFTTVGGYGSNTRDSVNVGNNCINCFEFVIALENNGSYFNEDYGRTITLPEKGLYIGVGEDVSYATHTIIIPGFTGFPPVATTKRMDEKYMPLLTDEEGCKWKLVVDPDGTLRAEQVAG